MIFLGALFWGFEAKYIHRFVKEIIGTFEKTIKIIYFVMRVKNT